MVSNYIKININQLLPQETLPCSIYFFFKGQYIEALKKEKVIAINFITKSLIEENYFAYIKEEDKNSWQEWLNKTRRVSSLDLVTELDENPEIAIRKAKFLQFAATNIRSKTESMAQTEIFNMGLAALREKVHHPFLIPFFLLNFSDNILKHNSRVSFAIILFILTHPELLNIDDANDLIFSTIIHELTGDPASVTTPHAHQESMEFILKNKMIFKEQILTCLTAHDQIHKDDSSHMGLRIFSLINHFDHIYLNCTQSPSRKIKLEKSLEFLEAKEADFDSTVLTYFKNFIQKIDYIV